MTPLTKLLSIFRYCWGHVAFLIRIMLFTLKFDTTLFYNSFFFFLSNTSIISSHIFLSSLPIFFLVVKVLVRIALLFCIIMYISANIVFSFHINLADGRTSSLVLVRRSKCQAWDEGDCCGIVTDCDVLHRMGSITRWRQRGLQRGTWWKMKTLCYLGMNCIIILSLFAVIIYLLISCIMLLYHLEFLL